MNKLFRTLRTISNKRKCNLIYKLGFRYFYDNFQPDTDNVHIPDFLQNKKRKVFAQEQTNIHLEQIIKNKALDKCYKSALKYERELMANKLKSSLLKAIRCGR